MKTVNIELNEEEANQLIKVLDLALKQVGLSDGGEMANSSLYFLNKFNTAFNEENAEEKVLTKVEDGKSSTKEKVA